MREYVVGYYNKAVAKDAFVILATMDSKNVAMFVRNSYNNAYKEVGITTETVLLASRDIPKNYRFSE